MSYNVFHAKEKLPTNGTKVHTKCLEIHESFLIIKLWIKLNSILYITHIRVCPNIEERDFNLYIWIYKTDKMESFIVLSFIGSK